MDSKSSTTAVITAVVVRADGTREDLGVIAQADATKEGE